MIKFIKINYPELEKYIFIHFVPGNETIVDNLKKEYKNGISKIE
ncbi:hypothetical protein [Candidatus Phytoplasma pini]|nr:hypothetical protein [Candidatus Phytoplasma pini]